MRSFVLLAVGTLAFCAIGILVIHLWCGGAGYDQIPVASDTVPRIDVDRRQSMQLPLPAVRIASARADLDRDGTPEELELRSDVERADDGGLLWEDGHRWVVLVRDGDREDRLVDQFVPQGRLTAWVVEQEAGSPLVVVLMESGTVGIELRAFRHADGQGYVAAGSFVGNGRLIARLLEEAPDDPAPRSPR